MLIHDDVMDCVTKFDIELDKDIFYAGETLTGHIIVQNTENIKVQGGCPPHRGSCTGLIQKRVHPLTVVKLKSLIQKMGLQLHTQTNESRSLIQKRGSHTN